MTCSFFTTPEPTHKGTRHTLHCNTHGEVGDRFLDRDLEELAESHASQHQS